MWLVYDICLLCVHCLVCCNQHNRLGILYKHLFLVFVGAFESVVLLVIHILRLEVGLVSGGWFVGLVETILLDELVEAVQSVVMVEVVLLVV